MTVPLPRPRRVVFDNGSEFIGFEFLEMLASYNWFREIQRMLQAIAWAIRATVNTAMKYTPGQMIFQRDMITAAQVTVNWDRVQTKRMAKSTKDNERENANRLAHTYVVRQQVWVRIAPSDRKWKLNAPFEGPFPIRKVFANGTLRIQRGAYEETIHIRRVKPYVDSDELR